jgi:hypothetical protein
MIPYLLAALALPLGWILRWRLTAARGTWVTRCGNCAQERTGGPRRQLFVEIWDSNGTMYKQWHVGRQGEFKDTRAPGPWLWDQISAEVKRVTAYIDGGGLTLVKQPPADAGK